MLKDFHYFVISETKMNSNDLIKDLKNRKFSPVYLLHGEESFYIDQISDYIEENVLSAAEKSFNQTIFYGKDSDPMSILNAAKRYPMMSDYQVILVKEAQDLKWGKDGEDDKKSGDPLLGYFENPLPSTILVFCYRNGKFDKRKKIFKILEKNGLVFESPSIHENKVPTWIEAFVRERGYSINVQASALVAEYLGNDLSKVANELEKMMLNVSAGKEISTQDIQNNIGISKDYNVFELQNAIARKDAYKVNQIINYFADNPKNNPIQLLLGALNSYFTKILKYHHTGDKSPQTLASALGIAPFFVREYEQAARNYSKEKVFRIISYLRDYDLKIKGVDASANTEQGELMKELMFKIIH
jgi:DNA polymerase-3 subunit delta